jgi:presenilin-like A22 family membrane protease
VVGVWGLLVGLIALTVYDHIFADRNDWMFDIADIFLRARIPIIVYKPPSWRFDWDRLYDEVDDETETPTHSWGIGTADLALVAAFAAAVATLPPDSLLAAGPLAVVGVVAGSVVGCLRLRYELLTDGSGAGLPALTTGMVAGLAVVQVPLLALAAV